VKQVLYLLFIILIIGKISGVSAAEKKNMYKQTRFMLDTYVTIHVFDYESVANDAIIRAFNRMQSLDVKFNHLNPKSPIFEFNQYGSPITDPEILKVVRVALDVSRVTDGAIDITICPLVELWGFYGESPHVPNENDIKDCLKKIGYKNLKLSEDKLERLTEVKIDLGALAKGYIISQAVEVLKENNISSGLVDAGGKVYALGKKEGKMWKVGIRDPRKEASLGYLEISDAAIGGSGDYERFFMENGIRYHHILSPKTGYPAKGIIACTTIHKEPLIVDVWNTTLVAMGDPVKAIETAEQVKDLQAIIVTDDGSVLCTSELNKNMNIIKKAD